MAHYSLLKFVFYFSDMVVSNSGNSVTVTNIGTCARNCTHSISYCNSFFFNTIDNTCLVCPGLLHNNNTDLVQRVGMQYYVTEKSKLCLNRQDYNYEGPGLCLKYVTSTMTWPAARDKCHEDGGSLVKIDSNEKNTHLKRVYGQRGISWLGGNDLSLEGTWVWLDGTLVTQSLDDWKGKEPDGGMVQNCMTLSSTGWNNGGCTDSSRPFLCEIPLV